jgi:hypothetical protein
MPLTTSARAGGTRATSEGPSVDPALLRRAYTNSPPAPAKYTPFGSEARRTNRVSIPRAPANSRIRAPSSSSPTTLTSATDAPPAAAAAAAFKASPEHESRSVSASLRATGAVSSSSTSPRTRTSGLPSRIPGMISPIST